MHRHLIQAAFLIICLSLFWKSSAGELKPIHCVPPSKLCLLDYLTVNASELAKLPDIREVYRIPIIEVRIENLNSDNDKYAIEAVIETLNEEIRSGQKPNGLDGLQAINGFLPPSASSSGPNHQQTTGPKHMNSYKLNVWKLALKNFSRSDDLIHSELPSTLTKYKNFGPNTERAISIAIENSHLTRNGIDENIAISDIIESHNVGKFRNDDLPKNHLKIVETAFLTAGQPNNHRRNQYIKIGLAQPLNEDQTQILQLLMLDEHSGESITMEDRLYTVIAKAFKRFEYDEMFARCYFTKLKKALNDGYRENKDPSVKTPLTRDFIDAAEGKVGCKLASPMTDKDIANYIEKRMRAFNEALKIKLQKFQTKESSQQPIWQKESAASETR